MGCGAIVAIAGLLASTLVSHPGSPLPRSLGRYVLHEEIAAGGVASVHFGRLFGPSGFARTVAIKRLHPELAKDPDFVAMFKDEARLAARVRHPNVVSIVDVVSVDEELFLVMDYVHGESLARLARRSREQSIPLPLGVLSAILCGALHGLHAAHEAKNDAGEPIHLVHRDVSPQNLFVGAEGVARVLDFGVAKALGRLHATRNGMVKGKAAYMAPEQVAGQSLDRRADVYAMGIVLWEMLTERSLFGAGVPAMNPSERMARLPDPPSKLVPSLAADLDAVALTALRPQREKRFATAKAMADALERAVGVASPSRVVEWVEGVDGDHLRERARMLERIEGREAI
jgi:serine/threonine protein kinase